ncbi:PfaB family protein [Shewanella acanthi]|uniref:PfaB family protein n=1 Tax=Shewanella acanthi TaxID=2864212 RepID=UPI0021ABAF47|nr:PfaB family protein [Shewanella acanthi]
MTPTSEALKLGAHNSEAQDAKSLRIALFLGNTLLDDARLGDAGLSGLRDAQAQHAIALQALFESRVQINIDDTDSAETRAAETTAPETDVQVKQAVKHSLVALLNALRPDIEANKLIEISASAHIQSLAHSSTKGANQAQKLYLLDGLLAAQLCLHPEAYISAFNETSLETNAETSTKALESSIKSAFAMAKRKRFDAMHYSFEVGGLNSQLDTLIQGVSALSLRSVENLASQGSFSQIQTQTQSLGQSTQNELNSAQGYWFCRQHQARVLGLTLLSKSADPTSNEKTADNDANAQAESAQPAITETVQSLVLTQGSQLSAKPLLTQQRLFIPISGDSIEYLKSELLNLINQGLVKTLQGEMDTDFPLALCQTWLSRYRASDKLALVLMATSAKELIQEANAMQAFIEGIDENTPKAWSFKTPAGSYFAHKPLGDKGLAFVYPGVGTVYPNMFNDLHSYFPTLYRELEREGDLAAMLQAEAIYTADVTDTDRKDMSLSEQAISGVGASYVFTKLLTQIFGIKPQFALGYSMGEAAMWASLDIWQTPHALIHATQNSDIFNQQISGKLEAVRHEWGLSDDAPVQWNSFLVRATGDEINAVLTEFPRVYLAIEQGDTCIIAGCETSCRQLLAKLGKRGIASNKITAMHTAPSLSQHAKLEQFYNQAIKDGAKRSQIRFISASQSQPVTVDSHRIAKSIADTFCAPLNFTALIQNTYAQGARLFVEVGADRQTSTLIDKIFRQLEQNATHQIEPEVEQQHEQAIALATNAKGADTITTLLKCLSQLISHRVPLSMTPLSLEHLSLKHMSLAPLSPAAPICSSSHFSNVFQEGEPL